MTERLFGQQPLPSHATSMGGQIKKNKRNKKNTTASLEGKVVCILHYMYSLIEVGGLI